MQLSKDERVLGMVLINATGMAAGFVETHREKVVIGRRLSKSGFNSAIEQRLASHRFGTVSNSAVSQFSQSSTSFLFSLSINHFESINRRNEFLLKI